jgi:hypothetical protein
VSDITGCIFGTDSALAVAARRQAAHIHVLAYGGRADYTGVGVVPTYHAVRDSLGCLVILAIQRAMDGIGGTAGPLIAELNERGLHMTATEYLEQVRLQMRVATTAGKGVGSRTGSTPFHPAVTHIYGPRNDVVMPVGEAHGGSGAVLRRAAIRVSSGVEADEQQREFSARISRTMVALGHKPLGGLPRTVHVGDVKMTPTQRQVNNAARCPFFLAGNCMAGEECTQSHGRSAARFGCKVENWPASGGYAALRELYAAHVGQCTVP